MQCKLLTTDTEKLCYVDCPLGSGRRKRKNEKKDFINLLNFLLYLCFAKEKIFSSNDTQETIIKIMKKEHWNLVEEKMNGLDYVNKSIKENKNKFSAIWNFEKFDDKYSMFYGFKCNDVSFEFLAGYLSRITFSVKASPETINLQKTNFIKNKKLTFLEEKNNDILFLDSEGNIYIFREMDESFLYVSYIVKNENLYYERKLKQ